MKNNQLEEITMTMFNTMLGAALGTSLLLLGACADTAGPATSSSDGLGHVTMALTNSTDANARAHVMVWTSSSGELAFEDTFDLAADATIQFELGLDVGLHIADVEVLNDDGLTLNGSGTAEFDVSDEGDLDIQIALGAAVSASSEEGDSSVDAEVGVGVGVSASSDDEGDSSVDAEVGVGVGVSADSDDEGDGSVDAEVGVGVSASSDDDDDDDDDDDAEVGVSISIHLGLGG